VPTNSVKELKDKRSDDIRINLLKTALKKVKEKSENF